MNDTEKEIAEIYRKMLCNLSPQTRLKMAAEMFSDCQKIVKDSLQQQNLPDQDIRLEIFRRFYCCDFTKVECEKIIAHLQAFS